MHAVQRSATTMDMSSGGGVVLQGKFLAAHPAQGRTESHKRATSEPPGLEATRGASALQMATRGVQSSSASGRRHGRSPQQVVTAPVAPMKQAPVNSVPNALAADSKRARGGKSAAIERSMKQLSQQLDRFKQEHLFLGQFQMLGRSAQRRGGEAPALPFKIMLPRSWLLNV